MASLVCCGRHTVDDLEERMSGAPELITAGGFCVFPQGIGA